ncbi:MAG: aspartate aminotransferase [Methanoregula sp. PtaU1.Bin051]|nr:MAG: aspartate aminotransferase [Methanoregula sp. PtaU1.Bin051]
MAYPFTFAARMGSIPASFLDTLFTVSADPAIISFAGGLPSSSLIDVAGIRRAAHGVLEDEGATALQYMTTDGYLPLREYIADRYRRRLNIPATAAEIQIVNGSQQCLDLIAKILVNPGNSIGIERPGYLGAFEAFSLYEPVFAPVPLEDDGPDLAAFKGMLAKHNPGFTMPYPIPRTPRAARTPVRSGRRSPPCWRTVALSSTRTTHSGISSLTTARVRRSKNSCRKRPS